MSRSNPRRRQQPPSPPMSHNGDLGLNVDGNTRFNPYTPPGSVGPIPHDQIHEQIRDRSPPTVSTTGQPPPYYSPQLTFTRDINHHATPIGTKSVAARSGLRSRSPVEQPTQRLSRGATAGKRRADNLPGPLSEITQGYSVPVRDMESWVNRPIEQRLREAAAKRGHVARPLNSFMLYRSAYAERVKQYCRENNHQVVSRVTGQSWPLETKEIRDLYIRLAMEEKNNHKAAHPTYKFTPNKSGKKRRRSEHGDDDSDGDSEWRAPRQTKSRRVASHGQRSPSPSPSPYAAEPGWYAVMHPPASSHPSSYQAMNPHAPVFHQTEYAGMQSGYPQISQAPYELTCGNDLLYQEATFQYPPGTIDSDFGLTGMPDGSNDLFADSSYVPVFSGPAEQFIDPNLGQPDGTYTYEDREGPSEAYIVPRFIPDGSLVAPTSLCYQQNVHPGLSMLSGPGGGWYNAQENGSEFGGDFHDL